MAHNPGRGRFVVLGSRVKRKPRSGAQDDDGQKVSWNGGSGRGTFGMRTQGPVHCTTEYIEGLVCRVQGVEVQFSSACARTAGRRGGTV